MPSSLSSYNTWQKNKLSSKLVLAYGLFAVNILVDDLHLVRVLEVQLDQTIRLFKVVLDKLAQETVPQRAVHVPQQLRQDRDRKLLLLVLAIVVLVLFLQLFRTLNPNKISWILFFFFSLKAYSTHKDGEKHRQALDLHKLIAVCLGIRVGGGVRQRLDGSLSCKLLFAVIFIYLFK